MIELTRFGRKNSKLFITYQHFCHEFLAGHQLHQSLHGAHRPTPIIHHWFIRGIWRPDVSEETARGLDRQIQQLRWKASKSGNIAIVVDLVEVMHECLQDQQWKLLYMFVLYMFLVNKWTRSQILQKFDQRNQRFHLNTLDASVTTKK